MIDTRKFLVGWQNKTSIDLEEVELPYNVRANQKNFAKVINDGLNHYHGYYCTEYDIRYWSLIEE